jgi:uncharacterized protein YdeI (BOF family)
MRASNRSITAGAAVTIAGSLTLAFALGCSSWAPPTVSLGVLAPASDRSAAAPVALRIADVRADESVIVEGTVLRQLDADLIRLADDSGTIRVLVGLPDGLSVAAGDRLRIEGRVHDPKRFGLSRPEIHATAVMLPSGERREVPPPAAGDATREAPATAAAPTASTPSTASTPTVDIATLRRGQPADVRGTISRILDSDEFRLTDETGSVRVYIGWRNRIPAAVGSVVRVSGVMDDDPWPVRPELYADTITLEDGSVVDLRTGVRTAAPGTTDTPPAPRARLADGIVPVVPITSARPEQTVAVRGVIERILDEDVMRIRDESGSLPVYIGWRNRVPAPVGETVTVLGAIAASGPGGVHRELYAFELQREHGSIIDLQRPDMSATSGDIAIGRRSAASSATPAAGATTLGDPISIASVRRGQSVVLAGVVDRLRDSDEFVLRDDSGTIEVYIGWRNRMPVRPGDRVTVAGIADDDVLPGFRPDVYADRIQLADGRIVTLRTDD